MNWIFAGLLFLSVVFALLTGRTQELTTAASTSVETLWDCVSSC